MNADGTGQTEVTDKRRRRATGQPAFSPDGQRIAFMSNRNLDVGGAWEIYVMNANGTNQDRAHEQRGPGRHQPRLSRRTARKIAFMSDRDDGPNNQVFVMNDNGQQQDQLTGPALPTSTPPSRPTARQIAFASGARDAGGNSGVPKMNVDGPSQTSGSRATPRSTSLPNWGPPPADRDGDALPDVWETLGYRRATATAPPRWTSRRWAADPDRKDIFVEMDSYVLSLGPSGQTSALVIDSVRGSARSRTRAGAPAGIGAARGPRRAHGHGPRDRGYLGRAQR